MKILLFDYYEKASFRHKLEVINLEKIVDVAPTVIKDVNSEREKVTIVLDYFKDLTQKINKQIAIVELQDLAPSNFSPALLSIVNSDLTMLIKNNIDIVGKITTFQIDEL